MERPRRPRRRWLFGRLPPPLIVEDDVGLFWHATDWHVNEFMPADANPCDMCRTPLAAAACSKGTIGPYGHPDCDPSPAGWREALKLMVRIAPEPDFILAGGDYFGHVAAAKEGRRSVRSAALLFTSMMHAAFPNVPTMHTIGNHDTHPYYSTAAAWRGWENDWRADGTLGDAYVDRQFPGEALRDWRAGGFYARALRDGLTGISINTNDLALTGGAEQLAWLERLLSRLRKEGKAAVLLGHIPPGPSHYELDSICRTGHYYAVAGGACWDALAQARVVQLLAKFSDVVPASYFGHHHTASLRVISAPADDGGSAAREQATLAVEAEDGGGGVEREGGWRGAEARHVMYLSPSLTPRNPTHDPALRLYRYSRRTGAPLDYEEYTLDLGRANRERRAQWDRRPSALRTPPLNLTSLAPAEWARALRAMLQADFHPTSTRELQPDDPFLQWVSPERCAREAYVGSGAAAVPPLRKCKLAHVCAALHIADDPYAECISGAQQRETAEHRTEIQ